MEYYNEAIIFWLKYVFGPLGFVHFQRWIWERGGEDGFEWIWKWMVCCFF